MNQSKSIGQQAIEKIEKAGGKIFFPYDGKDGRAKAKGYNPKGSNETSYHGDITAAAIIDEIVQKIYG
jgi:hypothetical protein